jgi:hypothetical protein
MSRKRSLMIPRRVYVQATIYTLFAIHMRAVLSIERERIESLHEMEKLRFPEDLFSDDDHGLATCRVARGPTKLGCPKG